MICVELTKTDETTRLKRASTATRCGQKEAHQRKLHFAGRATRTHKPQTKIETRESDIYYVLASFIEVDGRPYSLELVKRTKSDDMFEKKMCSTIRAALRGRVYGLGHRGVS